MPRVDELLDRLGALAFIRRLDLTKGYWQIPLSPLSKEKTAFTTPFGLHQFVTLPVRLFGDSGHFQRLMDKVLRPHSAYAAAYLDDIIIHSNDWQRHYGTIYARSWGRCGRPGSRHKPAEVCNWAGRGYGIWASTWVMGRCVPKLTRRRQLRPCPSPKTKKEVRQFLGLAGYYRRLSLIFRTSPAADWSH